MLSLKWLQRKKKEKYEKQKNTMKANKNASHLMRCVQLFKGKGTQETNTWRLEVILAHFNNSLSSSCSAGDIARETRKEKGSKNWDGHLMLSLKWLQ